ncbi:MAG: hypothetical protein GX057_07850 [Clostridiales bacterium]|nr:hypothetical protein [Clostridiales bacterium]
MVISGKMSGGFGLTGVGYLIIRTTTARSAVPVSGATVTIKGAEPELSEIHITLKTDHDGMTEKETLPCPPKTVRPVIGQRPYSLYDIHVHAEGYVPRSCIGIPIFDGITSYQTIDLVATHDELPL